MIDGAVVTFSFVRRAEWVGSPSSSAHLSFSSISNRHIRNKQELPEYDPNSNPIFDTTLFAPGKPRKLKGAALRAKLREDKRVKELEEGFVGNPHSYHRLTFSSTVNKTFSTKQEIPEYKATYAVKPRKVPRQYDPESVEGLQQKLKKVSSDLVAAPTAL